MKNDNNKRSRDERGCWFDGLEKKFIELETKPLAGQPSKDELEIIKSWTSCFQARIKSRIKAHTNAELVAKRQERKDILEAKVCLECKKKGDDLHSCECFKTDPDSDGSALCIECAGKHFLEKKCVDCSTHFCNKCDDTYKCKGCGEQSCAPCAEENQEWQTCDGCKQKTLLCCKCADRLVTCEECEKTSCRDCGEFADCEGCGDIICDGCCKGGLEDDDARHCDDCDRKYGDHRGY